MAQVIILTGPTASGKSGLALQLAEALNGAILNADSMQVYRDLPILSAQPTSQDFSKAPHHLYSFLEPTDPYDASTWTEVTSTIITSLIQEKKVPIVVGGSGFYLKALLEGFSPIPSIPALFRENLRKEFLNKDPYGTLKEIDPSMATLLNPNDSQRILRALEVKLHTGMSLRDWQSLPCIKKLSYPHKVIVLNPSKEDLERRVKARVLQMMELGVIKEVQNLVNLNLQETSMIFKTLGYQQIKDFLLGKFSLNEMIQQVHIKTRQYAKRQRTWIRHQLTPDILLQEAPRDKRDLKSLLAQFLVS